MRLAGPAWYFGERYEKPYIGDDTRPVEAADVLRANRMLYAAGILALVLGLGLRILIVFWVR